jgi:hypothetical protein
MTRISKDQQEARNQRCIEKANPEQAGFSSDNLHLIKLCEIYSMIPPIDL